MKYECNDKYRELEVLGIKTNDYNCKTIYQLKRNAVRDSLMHILSKTSYWEPAANDVNGRINSSISYNYNYLRVLAI